MKATLSQRLFWRSSARGSTGEQSSSSSRGRKILKNSTIGIAALALLGKIKFYLTRDSEFESKVKLVFPEYNYFSESEDDRKVKIVSEN
jgi:hypothetical protein